MSLPIRLLLMMYIIESWLHSSLAFPSAADLRSVAAGLQNKSNLEFRVNSLELFSLRCDLELYNLGTAFGGRRESQFECFLIL